MIKLIIGLIIAILIILGIYTYSNQTTEKSVPIPSISVKKKDVKKTEEVLVVAQKGQEKKSSAKNVTVKSPKVVSKETRKEMVDNKDEIGKGITQEAIDNARSEEEKAKLLGDYIYRQSIDSPEPAAEIDEDILLDILKKDISSNN